MMIILLLIMIILTMMIMKCYDNNDNTDNTKHYKETGIYQGKTRCTRFPPGENLVLARAAWHPGFCQGKTWYTSFSPGAATSPPGKYQGKTWWTDLAGHPRFPPGVRPGFYQAFTRETAMVKSWYPGKVQALAWQSPRR